MAKHKSIKIQRPTSTKVIMVEGSDPYKNTWNILSAAGKNFINDVRSPLLIKPNLTFDDIRPGVTTDPNVVKAILDFLNKYVSLDEIIIAESSSKNTIKAYERLGYNKVFQNYTVEMIDLNEDESKDFEIVNPLTGNKYNIPISKIVLDCSYIISCALLKTHDTGIGTFSIKNMMGAIVGDKSKKRMHGGRYSHDMTNDELKRCVNGFHRNIADLVKMVYPNFSIIDGTIGLEGNGPIDGEPRRMDIALGGQDPVAVDAVASYLIGFDPMEIGYIYLCEKMGLGIADLSRIQVSLEGWTKHRKSFKPHERYSYMTFAP
jgi:uncharacterized protein (DUF362 family)